MNRLLTLFANITFRFVYIMLNERAQLFDAVLVFFAIAIVVVVVLSRQNLMVFNSIRFKYGFIVWVFVYLLLENEMGRIVFNWLTGNIAINHFNGEKKRNSSIAMKQYWQMCAHRYSLTLVHLRWTIRFWLFQLDVCVFFFLSILLLPQRSERAKQLNHTSTIIFGIKLQKWRCSFAHLACTSNFLILFSLLLLL